MSRYSTWSIDALRGYIVMNKSFISGSVSESIINTYKKTIDDVTAEIEKRENEQKNEEKLIAFPKTNVSDSVPS